ncbi:thiamine transport system ATP-binding protein [Williamsia muralis]|uniref:ABC-type quaternary amine transporter n=1 Tax=Williamsia marianensis TaxID=85044 RepID=A0A495K2L5_WILMA|nr:ABC transporter ATP-binding protein [Williamsia muralis]RKR94699.1 thiamine transport system ATP-binding protein [Williamsia muralis]
MLQLSSVTVGYRSETVLDDLSLSIGTEGSAITALLGPSGCGKSTLIRAIAGLEPLTGGTITFDGADLAPIATHRRDFGVVFQDGQLLPGRSVADNIGYGLRARRWRRDATAARVAEMLDLVDLSGYGNRQVAELSGGQQQRVALARALAPRPRLLLLDEPLSALDRQLRERLAVEIAEIIDATGTPTIVVTHDHTEAALMADHIAVMDRGRIIQHDDPASLWRAPRNERVARFIGCTTICQGTVRAGVLDSDLGAVALDVPDGRVRIGLRPDAVTAVPLADAGQSAPVGTVRHVASLPEGTRVRLSVAGIDVDAVSSAAVSLGDRMAIALDAHRLAVITEHSTEDADA